MGIDPNAVEFLLCAKELGADFSATAMLGRQGLHLDPARLQSILRKAGHSLERETVSQWFESGGGFAEPLLEFLGAELCESFDYSRFEGANYVWDMNETLPEQFKNKYSVVVDCGTLEHIFNVPRAIQGMMEMTKEGGHTLIVTPANNFCGHGFYQFSPELFYASFAEGNGFKVVAMVAYEDQAYSKWFIVRNPKELQRRIMFTNSAPTYLAILAKRTKWQEVLQQSPQQSDYVAAWRNAAVGTGYPFQRSCDKESRSALATLPTLLGRIAYRGLLWVKQLISPGSGLGCFEPISRQSLVRQISHRVVR
jgi:hypothetical protein